MIIIFLRLYNVFKIIVFIIAIAKLICTLLFFSLELATIHPDSIVAVIYGMGDSPELNEIRDLESQCLEQLKKNCTKFKLSYHEQAVLFRLAIWEQAVIIYKKINNREIRLAEVTNCVKQALICLKYDYVYIESRTGKARLISFKEYRKLPKVRKWRWG